MYTTLLIIILFIAAPIILILPILLLIGAKTKDPEQIIKDYRRAGLEFGSAVSDLLLGQCIGFEKMFKKWQALEKEYVGLGYRAISIDAFERAAGWGHNIDELYQQQLEEGEEPVFHADIYEKYFLNQMAQALDAEKLISDGEPQFGTYFTPSTEKIAELHRQRKLNEQQINEDDNT